jgi:hypothetical protein
VEVDYHKIRCNNDCRILTPRNFSRKISRQYTFAEREGAIMYDELPLFDVRAAQPEIHLYKVRFDSGPAVQSMVKYVEFSNVFKASEQQYVIFIAGNTLMVDVASNGAQAIRINEDVVEIATIFFNEAISFIPCFKYADGEGVIMSTSPHIHYLVDKGGQFVDKRIVKSRLIVPVRQQKFEQRILSGDIYDELVRFLSDKQAEDMEVSYTRVYSGSTLHLGRVCKLAKHTGL